MAEWHLKELRLAIERRGWRLAAEHCGDNYGISASWEIERSGDAGKAFIDFEGLDELQVLPVTKAYGCHVRDRRSVALYFGSRGEKGSSKRSIWNDELNRFVAALGVFQSSKQTK